VIGKQAVDLDFLVGVAGFEPTTSSSRSRSGVLRNLQVREFALVRALVCIGSAGRSGPSNARSSPRFLPGDDRAAPLIRRLYEVVSRRATGSSSPGQAPLDVLRRPEATAAVAVNWCRHPLAVLPARGVRGPHGRLRNRRSRPGDGPGRRATAPRRPRDLAGSPRDGDRLVLALAGVWRG
jgi:hypothetical protein